MRFDTILVLNELTKPFIDDIDSKITVRILSRHLSHDIKCNFRSKFNQYVVL